MDWRYYDVKHQYVIKERNEDMVTVNMIKFTNMEGFIFQMDTKTYEKITETSQKYENFIYIKDKQEKTKNTDGSFNHLHRHLLIDRYLLTVRKKFS